MSCEKKKIPSDCIDDNSCDDEYVTHIYKNEIGTVRKFVFTPSSNPDNFIYIIMDSNNKALVTCPKLSNSLKVDGLTVKFSGKKTNCCQLIAQENWRTGIGCKLDVTSIRKAVP